MRFLTSEELEAQAPDHVVEVFFVVDGSINIHDGGVLEVDFEMHSIILFIH